MTHFTPPLPISVQQDVKNLRETLVLPASPKRDYAASLLREAIAEKVIEALLKI